MNVILKYAFRGLKQSNENVPCYKITIFLVRYQTVLAIDIFIL